MNAYEADIEAFYTDQMSKKAVRFVMGDSNATIKNTAQDEYLRKLIEKHRLGERNERGEKLLQFA